MCAVPWKVLLIKFMCIHCLLVNRIKQEIQLYAVSHMLNVKCNIYMRYKKIKLTCRVVGIWFFWRINLGSLIRVSLVPILSMVLLGETDKQTKKKSRTFLALWINVQWHCLFRAETDLFLIQLLYSLQFITRYHAVNLNFVFCSSFSFVLD